MREATPAAPGRWVEVSGSCRCSQCGGMTQSTWRWFASVSTSTWTHALCPTCVTKLTEEES